MTTLPTEFTKKGFHHRQLERIGDVALFERHRVGGTVRHWEVVKVGRHNGWTIEGVTVPPGETYPTAEQWGSKGWTYTDEQLARNSFNLTAGNSSDALNIITAEK